MRQALTNNLRLLSWLWIAAATVAILFYAPVSVTVPLFWLAQSGVAVEVGATFRGDILGHIAKNQDDLILHVESA